MEKPSEPNRELSTAKGKSEMKKLALRVAFLAAVVFLATLLYPGASQAQGTAPATFKAKCAACHGADGKGATSVGKALGIGDLGSADTQKMSDADLAQIISKGKDKMPAYGSSLKESEIKDLVQYIRTFGKKK
jgi:cytochrome c6